MSSELSDEERRKLLKPNPSNDEIVAVIKASFTSPENDSVEIVKELDSYDDRNWWMKIGGVSHLVKVHNGVESEDAVKAVAENKTDSVIHFQYAMMKALGENGVSSSVPIKTTPFVQSLPVVSSDHSPCQLVVSVYSWVEGITMSSLKVLPLECIMDAGQFLGRVQKHWTSSLKANDFPNSSKRYHQWDGKNTKDLANFLHCIEDTKRRTMIESILQAFDEKLIESGVADTLRKGINHGDYNDANILLDSNFKVCGVIDFGDSVQSWTVLDVSTAMAYAMLTPYGKKGRSVSAAAAFLRGFHTTYELTDTERDHLPLLIACRLACSVTLGAYSYQKNPENKYLLLHAEPAWKALEYIWGYPGDDHSKRGNQVRVAMKALFDLACDTTTALPENSSGDGEADGDDGIYCSDLAIPDAYLLDLQNVIAAKKLKEDGSTPKRQKTSDGRSVITFVTGNKKKLEEVERILQCGTTDSSSSATNFTLTNAKIDLPELQGDPIDIAKKKCEEAVKQINGAVITEDTSLCFTALKELPGPYIKWFLEKCGHDGLNKMIGAHDDKSAYAQTVVAYCAGPNEPVHCFDGRTMGKIVPARGKLDFGWDPIFEPDEGEGKTYAEMSKDEKDTISHRSRAFAKLRTFLLEKEQATKS